MKRPGVSVIEVLIAVGIAAIVIAAVGNLIGATHRLTTQSGKEIQATAYAKQWLEKISDPEALKQYFGCSCGSTGTCVVPSSCLRLAGGGDCIVRNTAGFKSCWVDAPVGTSPFTFAANGSGGWEVTDTPPTSFTRTMTITNIGGNTSTKNVTVTVAWSNGTATRQTQLSTILTAWKNF